MARLSIHLLGQLLVLLDDEPVTGFESDKVRALLAYLAVESDRAHRREALAGLLWPERPERSALNNLRGALSNLRQAIKDQTATPPFILATRQTLQFNLESDYWLDVSGFAVTVRNRPTAAVAPQVLEEMISRYRGPFLEGFSLKDSAAFDEWSSLRREQIGREVVRACEQLVTQFEQVSALDQSLVYAWKWTEFDPFDEAAHRKLMRLLSASGQRTAALAQYETLCITLADELGVEPSEETQTLHRTLLDDELETVPPQVTLPEEARAPSIDLPVSATPFVGRVRELERIAERLNDPGCRLLTLTGPGGVGKTRLAIQAARDQYSAFLDGVFFVPLMPLTSSEFLVSAIAAAIRFAFYGPDPPQKQLLDYLLGQKTLLVLDNFEHLLDGVGLVGDILSGAPHVKLLVTSRERLNLQGEWIIEIEGMDFPAEGVLSDVEAYDAVRLFLNSAHRVRPEFTLDDGEKQWVARLCQLMLGLPLGIELCAAWVRTLTTEQIVREVEGGFEFLSSSLRDVPERHRSLWAAFDHSWKLLSEDEQKVFRRLSVFRGSFERDAAEHIADASLAILSTLVDKSLVHWSGSGRYEINGLLRQYAHTKLVEAGEDEALLRQHRDWYLERAEQMIPELWSTAEALPRLDWLRAERDNYRSALEWSMMQQDAEEGLRLASALTWFWYIRADYTEGRRWLEQALKVGQDASPEIRAVTLGRAGNLAIMQRDHQHGIPLSEKGLHLLLQVGNLYEAGWTVNQLGIAARQQGDYEKADRLCTESLELFRQIGHQAAIASLLVYQGLVACYQRDYDRAESLLKEGLPVLREVGDTVAIARGLHGLGLIALHQGDLDRAKSSFNEGLSLVHGIRARLELAQCLEGLAAVAVQQEQLQQSCVLFGFSEQLRKSISTPLSRAEQSDYEDYLSALRSDLDEAGFANLWARGQTMTLDQALQYALDNI